MIGAESPSDCTAAREASGRRIAPSRIKASRRSSASDEARRARCFSISRWVGVSAF
jgi:hypothetical protein